MERLKQRAETHCEGDVCVHRREEEERKSMKGERKGSWGEKDGERKTQ